MGSSEGSGGGEGGKHGRGNNDVVVTMAGRAEVVMMVEAEAK